MYLISLLFQGVIGILLLVFIIATMIGVYSNLNYTDKTSKDTKPNEKADEQINGYIIYDKYVENEQKLPTETEIIDINYTEIPTQSEELEETDSTNLESTEEDEVQNSPESEPSADSKGEVHVSKSSARKYKKKRS